MNNCAPSSLHLLELLGEGRLGHVQALRGAAEVALLDESEEVGLYAGA